MSIEGFLNFDLVISEDGGHFHAKVIQSPAGEPETTFELPFSAQDLEIFMLKVSRPRRTARREIGLLDRSAKVAVREFGDKLFQAIFKEEVQVSLQRSLDEAEDRNAGLRLRLRFERDSPLAGLPWEYLYDSGRNRFFGLSEHTPIVRYLDLAERVRPLEVEPPLRVLVMISSPEDYPDLEVSREWAQLQEALSDLVSRGLVELVLLEEASLSMLRLYLRRKGPFHIFHFIGHGGFSKESQEGVLVFEEEGGRGRLVSGQDLGFVLHDHRSLRLSILNACEGAQTAQSDLFAGTAQSLVQQGIPAVVAMQFEISDDAALTFSHEFYSALADGYPVDAASSSARLAIFVDKNEVEWGTPVLYMRSDDGVIFDVSPGAVEQRNEPVPESPVLEEPVEVAEVSDPPEAPAEEPGPEEPSLATRDPEESRKDTADHELGVVEERTLPAVAPERKRVWGWLARVFIFVMLLGVSTGGGYYYYTWSRPARVLERQLVRGGRVEIAPGTYEFDHSLRLKESVDIIGSGNGDGGTTITSSVEGPVLSFDGPGKKIKISDITFEHSGLKISNVVEVSNGVVEVENATFRGGVGNAFHLGAGLHLGDGKNTSTTPKVRGNVRQSVFEENYFGLVLTGAARVDLSGNDIRRNAGRGLSYHGQSFGVASLNRIYANGYEGVEGFGRNDFWQGVGIQNGAHPTLQDNTICFNAGQGIHYLDTSWGRAERNLVENNSENLDNYRRTAEGQQKRDNSQGGIVIGRFGNPTDNPQPLIAGNTLIGNNNRGLVKCEATGCAEQVPNTVTRPTGRCPVGNDRPQYYRNLSVTRPRTSGDDVRAVQRKLQEFGLLAVGGVDGLYGPDTEGAVRRFQEQNDLEVDGIVGQKTWEKLFGLE